MNALFFASPRTNEQTIASVALEEWRDLWREIDYRVRGYERWPALYSDVAVYARAKYHTHLVGAHADRGSLVCELDGSPNVSLFLSVWEDGGDDGAMMVHYQDVPPFSEAQRVVLAARSVG
jgi:hypothetical protein